MEVILTNGQTIDLPPNEIAENISRLAAALAQCAGLSKESTEETTLEVKPSVDLCELHFHVETLPGDRIQFEGRVFDLSEIHWTIIDEILLGEGTATFVDVMCRIWGDGCEIGNNGEYYTKRLIDNIKKCRRRLEKLGLPFIVRHKNEKVFFSLAKIFSEVDPQRTPGGPSTDPRRL